LASLIVDYEFNGNLESSVAGAPDLISFGGGTYETATIGGNTVNVRTFTASGGLDFDNSAASFGQVHSIALLFEFDAIPMFARILDYHPSSENGLYYQDGLLIYYNYQSPVHDEEYRAEPDEYRTIVLTNDGTNVRGYVDGALQWTVSGAVANATPGGLLRFFKDNGAEHVSGSVARIQIYDSALDGAEVAALDLAIPEPSTALLFATGLAGLAVAGRRRLH
jgi:hypothetical protein